MDGNLRRPARRHPARAALAIVVVGLHAAGIVLLARMSLVRNVQQETPPITVNFIEQVRQTPQVPRLPEPRLARVLSVSVVQPEISVPREPASTAITVPVAQPALTSSPVAPARLEHGRDPPAMSEVAYLKQPVPRYPPESRHAREEGLVVLRVLVDESGHARDVEVARSSGHPRLDEAARAAVERALFKPYMDGGTARAATAMVPVEFSLHHSS